MTVVAIGDALAENSAFQGFMDHGIFAIEQAAFGGQVDVQIRGSRYDEAREQAGIIFAQMGWGGVVAGWEYVERLADLMEAARNAHLE